MGKLILVRHGRTHFNQPGKEERLRAWKDIPLDDCGLEEAEETAQQFIGCPVSIIYCSDLIRARQTAEALHRVTKAPIVPTVALRPWNLGALTGRRVQEIIPILESLNRRLSEKAPGGESFDEFYERYSKQLHTLLQIAERLPDAVVAVTHGRNLMALPTILGGGRRTQIPVMCGVPTAGMLVVEQQANAWGITGSHVNGKTASADRSSAMDQQSSSRTVGDLPQKYF
jgi:broad specificity phosphatase PhoE